MTVVTLAVAAALFVVGPPVVAAEPSVVVAEPPVVVAMPGSQPAGSIPGLDGDVRKVVERALDQYATAKSYEDSMCASVELDADGHGLSAPEPRELSLAYERSGRLAVRTPLLHIISDGKMLREAVEPWMQYVENAAPKPLLLSSFVLARFPFFNDSFHPIAAMLLRPGKPSLDFLGIITKLSKVQPDSLDGQPGQRVIGTLRQPNSRDDIDLQIWFDDKTGLIGEIVCDQTAAAKAYLAQRGITLRKYCQRYRFTQPRVNVTIPDDRFALKPETNLEKVSILKMPTTDELHERMVGRPGPAFSGTDIEGKPVQSADLKGQVVLLDFWATRCAPCVMSLPTLQKLADKYAGKPVSIIGVNLDGPDVAAQVANVLKQRKVTFRQIAQTKPSLGEKYFVKQIPFTVLLDGSGTIQSVHMGLANEGQLTQQIDRLLKGENLFRGR